MLYPDRNLQKRTQQNTTRYRTALYLRLSREDGDKTESDSIANQRTLLEAYAIDHPELCIVDEFVDDGYSAIKLLPVPTPPQSSSPTFFSRISGQWATYRCASCICGFCP